MIARITAWLRYLWSPIDRLLGRFLRHIDNETDEEWEKRQW